MAKTATSTHTAELRRCIGSKTFGIEPHEAPTADFPTQPSQKDGLGRMCKPHWRQYTNALRKAAVARKAAETEAAPAEGAEPVADPEPVAEPEAPRRSRRAKAEAATEVEEAIREVLAR